MTTAVVQARAKARADRYLLPAAVGAWVALVAATFLWGRGVDVRLGAPPLAGEFEWRLGPMVLPGLAIGTGVVVFGPLIAAKLSWRGLLVAATLAAAGWALALALADGWDALTAPLLTRYDYLHDVHRVTSVPDFLSNFTARLDVYTTHVRAHPPGMLMLLWGLGRIGVGPLGVALLIVAAGASSVVAVLIAARAVVGEEAARRCAPFLVVAPYFIWVATSADGLFMAVSAWAIALLVLATDARDRRADVMAAGGGLLFGCALFLSYGIGVLLGVPVVVAWYRRRLRPIVIGAIGIATVAAIFLAFGFSWFAGLAATLDQYARGISRNRPDDYFMVGNIAAFALALGPAIWAGVVSSRGRAWLLVGPALGAVLVANLSGLSQGEVERIWLPFAVWFFVAAAALRRSRAWLGLQVAAALGVQWAVMSPW
jgi:methylthioxylose transferase